MPKARPRRTRDISDMQAKYIRTIESSLAIIHDALFDESMSMHQKSELARWIIDRRDRLEWGWQELEGLPVIVEDE